MTRIETVLIVQKNSKILLGLKHPNKKFGGKWNGFGGGMEKEDCGSLEKCAIRETYNETGITPKNLKKLGKIIFHFSTKEQDHEVYFIQATEYEGELNTSDDFTKYKEFSPDELEKIYEQMMPADKHWIPYFIKEKLFEGEIWLGKENGKFIVENYKINEVKSLE